MAVDTRRQHMEGTIFVGGGTAPVLDKASGQPIASAGVAALADLDEAVAAAVGAQPDWAAASYEERAGVLRRAAAALEEQAGEIADLIVRETGSIRGKAAYEIHAPGNELHGGRSGGGANLEEFTERRWISLQRAPAHYPY